MEAQQSAATVGIAEHPAATMAAGLRRWIASGGCQSPTGAFYAWVDADTGEPAFEYPEITGYALTFLAGRDEPTAGEIRAGEGAADWLLARFEDGDLSARAAWDGHAVYNFDLAMIATGLIGFGLRVGSDAYLERGLSLVRDFGEQIRARGTLGSIPPGSGPSARSAWSTEGFAHLVKVVQSLVVGADAGEPGVVDCARAIVEQQQAIQRPNGRMITHPRDEETMLHPHLYAVEGLWAWGTAQSDGDALDRARRGVEWAFAHQLESGGLPRYVTSVSGERGPEQLDLTAQAVRMARALEVPVDTDAAISRMAECALTDERGTALVYQPHAPARHRNTWVSLFAAQAAELATPGAAPMHFRELV